MKKKVIGVYAPSNPAHIWFEEKYLLAKKQLEDMGFEIVEGDLVKDRVYQGYRTASAKERAEEMMNLVKNKDIDIMMPVIGGYNSGSLLPYLDFDEIEKSKKKFFGYSDITAIQLAILKKTNLKPIYGEEYLDRPIVTSEISRPGLELAGFLNFYPAERVQLLGRTETSFVASMDEGIRLEVMERLCKPETPCFIISRKLEPPKELVEAAAKAQIPILQATSKTTQVSSSVTNFLEGRLAERSSVHGVLLDVFGIGLLITGESGVGKSETALELVQKGHRLVADDRVELYQYDELTLIGEAPEILNNLIEIRGVGIVDVMTLFGAGAILDQKQVDLVVHLENWTPDKRYDRLGGYMENIELLGVEVPKIRIPVKTGRNVSIILEVACMNFRAKKMGFDATESFTNRLTQLIAENKEV